MRQKAISINNLSKKFGSFFVQFQIEGNASNGIANRYSSDLISQLKQTTDGVLDVLEVNLEQILLSVAKKGVAAHVGISS